MKLKVFEETKHTKFYVSEDGKIYSSTTYYGDKSLHEKKTTVNKSRGYVYVRTSKRNYQVHRLVAEAFIPKPNGKDYIDHKNGNRTDNRVENLEWVTQKENVSRTIARGRAYFAPKGSYKKYSQSDYDGVFALIKKGATYKEAGRQYGMPYSTVAHFMRGSRGVKNEN